jgi:ketosteroid isomerase-like protein
MTTMPSRSIAAEFFERINSRSLDQMGDFIKEDARFFFPKTQPLVGRDRIVKFFQVLFRQYPELHFRVHGIIAEGDRVAVHWTNQGITRRKEQYENEGVTLFEFEDGKIGFISDFFKDTGKF